MAIEKSTNPGEFADFERTGWEKSIVGYDGTFGTVTRQTVRATLDAANVRAGMAMLDVCCGPGMLAEAALSRGAKPLGLDFPDVVKLARTLVPGADFQSGDAQNLPFPDNSFDALVCGHGILHVADPEKTLKEMYRVLRPGGRAALTSWDIETPNAGLGMTYAAVRKYANLNISMPHGPDIFQFSTRDKMRTALVQLGFVNVSAIQFPQQWRVRSGRHIVDAMREGTVRTRAVLAAQTGEVIDKLIAFLEQGLAEARGADGSFNVPVPAIVGSGAKP